jgi:hypothetical protein
MSDRRDDTPGRRRAATDRDPNTNDEPDVTAPVELPSMPAGPGMVGSVGPVVARPPLGVTEAPPSHDGNIAPMPSEPAPQAADAAREGEGPLTPLVSQIQKQTGIDGGTAPDTHGQLVVGGGAMSRPGMMLRSAPGADAEPIGEVLGDTAMALLEGPHAHAGGEWWRVHLPDGRLGWASAEEMVPGTPI